MPIVLHFERTILGGYYWRAALPTEGVASPNSRDTDGRGSPVSGRNSRGDSNNISTKKQTAIKTTVEATVKQQMKQQLRETTVKTTMRNNN
jgi:hypothetical protein